MYLVVKEGQKFKLYWPEVFGLETAGSRSQTNLEKKRKYWYITNWTAGNDYVDDEIESYKLNVVLEATTLREALSYVSKETKNSQSAIESILVQAQEIQNERVAFENWAARRGKND
jgi:hypothetical protein